MSFIKTDNKRRGPSTKNGFYCPWTHKKKPEPKQRHGSHKHTGTRRVFGWWASLLVPSPPIHRPASGLLCHICLCGTDWSLWFGCRQPQIHHWSFQVQICQWEAKENSKVLLIKLANLGCCEYSACLETLQAEDKRSCDSCTGKWRQHGSPAIAVCCYVHVNKATWSSWIKGCGSWFALSFNFTCCNFCSIKFCLHSPVISLQKFSLCKSLNYLLNVKNQQLWLKDSRN